MSSSTQNVRKIDAPLLVDGDINNTSGLVNGRSVADDGVNLDTHLANDGLHRVINDSGSSTTDLWSASKTLDQLALKSDASHDHAAGEITGLTTDAVSEGATNLYHTSARADAAIDARRGAANGVASLNGDGKIPASQLLLNGSVTFQETWNASTNTPTLAAGGGGTTQKGFYYVVSTAGSTDVDGETDWNLGDWIISTGSEWQKADHTNAVSSISGKTGAVSLDTDDVTEATNLYWTDTRFDTRLATKSTTSLSEGTNKYYTEARVAANTAVAAATSHIGDVSKHRQINDAGSGATELWSAQKLMSEFGAVSGATHSHTADEITDLSTTTVPEGTKKYYTDGRVSANVSVAAATAHVADVAKHREIDDDGSVSTTTLWSSSKTDAAKVDRTQLCDYGQTAMFFDDFIGDGVSFCWSVSLDDVANTTSNVVHIDGVGGIIKVGANASANAYAELKMVTKQVAVDPDSRTEFRVRLNQTADTRVEFGARVDASEGMNFIFDTAESPNWQVENYLSNTATTTTTASPADTAWHVFEIVTRAADIRFYLGGALVATHTTNKPTAVMNVYARQTALAASAVDFNIDYVKFTSDRDGSGGGSDAGGDVSCVIC